MACRTDGRRDPVPRLVLGPRPRSRPSPRRRTPTRPSASVKIQADVYRADDDDGAAGGRLDSRRGADHRQPQVRPAATCSTCAATKGYALVSFDYRLAPEVKLPAIIEDVQDAFRWLREQGPKLLHIDPDRVVVTGGSAGGYLTLMTGVARQAAAAGPGRLLGLRRRGRRLVHQAVGALPQAGPLVEQGGGVQGRRRQGADRQRRTATTARPAAGSTSTCGRTACGRRR